MQFRPVVASFLSTTTVASTVLASVLLSVPAQASTTQASTMPSGTARPALAVAPATVVPRQGVITGVVYGAGAGPLTGVCVVATGPGGTSAAMTKADGRYVLALRPGGYVLHFSACAAGGRYVDQWSGGASWPQHATVLTVAAGQVRQVGRVTMRFTPTAPAASARPGSAPGASTIPAALLAGVRPATSAITAGTGGIAGTVTGNGAPLKGICVTAYGPSRRAALTSKTGQYQIGKLPPGRYAVVFLPALYCGKNPGNWLIQWYKGDTTPISPRHPVRVPVAAGKVTRGIDAAMRLGSEITGTTRSKAGKALPGVCVYLLGHVGRDTVSVVAKSGQGGHYVVHSLFKGTYFADFAPDCGARGNYVGQWYENSTNQAHARAIKVISTRPVTGIDAALPPGAVISGAVRATSAQGPLLGGICVNLSQGFPGGPYETTRTAANGSYKLDRLTTGKYQISFSPGCGNNGNYLPAQRKVSVRTGRTITGFDAFLPPGAIFTGVVTDAHGNPLRGICVLASRNNPYGAFGDGVTGADGSYSVDALPSGAYTVQFTGGCGNTVSYAPQFYHNQANVGSATPVALTSGKTTSGIDATMQPGATITGQVTDSAGHPVSRLCVSAVSPSELTYQFSFNQVSTKNGSYTFSNLIPGLYGVYFGCFFFGARPLGTQWFSSRLAPDSADLVSAPPGVVTSGINATLARSGFISGTVTNSAHVKLSDICVSVVPPGDKVSTQPPGPILVTDHGHYDFGPLSPGKYDVQFSDCFGHRYATQWYHGSVTQQSSTSLAVHSGSTTTGIDAVMAAGGSISGRVVNFAHAPLSRICVTATDAAAQSTSLGGTDSTGHYTVTGLTTGAYQVTFTDCTRQRGPAGTATRFVRVTAPRAVDGFNVLMQRGGSISGTVLGGGAATPLEGMCVVAVPLSLPSLAQSAYTDNNGNYQLPGLAPGNYNVYIGDPFCPLSGYLYSDAGYAPQWFKNQPSQATATTVTVPTGGAASNVNATLAAEGAISGVVTQQSHAPVAGECVTAVPVNPAPDPLLGDTMHHVIAVTGADGSYTLFGLPPGHYKVEFTTGCGASGLTTQWWDDAASAATATVITVSANATVPGIDATLHH